MCRRLPSGHKCGLRTCPDCRAAACWASAISSSRSPNLVAPVGQASAQAVGLPGHHPVGAHGALLHPRQTACSTHTWERQTDRPPCSSGSPCSGLLRRSPGPSAVLCSAPTGHTEAQAGSGAVHAQPPHELVALGQNDGELVFGLPVFGGDCLVVRQFVLVGAGLLRTACSRCRGWRRTKVLCS